MQIYNFRSLRMSCKQTFKEFFLKCDIFSTSEFLRYDNEPEYRTYTGAFCSVITVITFCAVFMNVMIGTFAKTEIIWSLNTVQSEADSFEVRTSLESENKFMFAAALSGIDLNTNYQLFDVKLLLRTKFNSISQPDQIITLQRCTPGHWNVTDQILQIYERMNFSTMLCPPKNLNIPIQGKFTSQIFRYAQIRIVKCSTSDNFSKICANESSLQNRTYYFNLYLLNTLINPESPEYLTYYMEDRNYVQFTTTFTSLVNIFVSNYKIATDESIWPVPQVKEVGGAVINNLGQVVPHQTDGNTFASFILRRSSTTITASRSFKKIDDTFSYIGGLFGFVLIFLLFMKEYTEYSFQIDASSHLYHEDDQNPIVSQNFNFLVFLGYLLYLFLDGLGFHPQWKQMKVFDDSREEIQKQFDVRFLFQRLNFIEKSLSLLFNEDQTQFMHLHRKPTLKEATSLRQNYLFKQMIENVNEMTEAPMNTTAEQFGLEQINNRVYPLVNQNDEVSNSNIISKMRGGLKMLRRKTQNGDHLSRKIIEDIDPNIIKIIHENHQENDSNKSQKIENSSIEKLEKSYRSKSKGVRMDVEIIEMDKQTAELAALVHTERSNAKKEQEIGLTFEFVN